MKHLSFDDMGFGYMSESGMCISERLESPSRPGGMTNVEWYAYAGSVLKLAMAEQQRAIGELAERQGVTVEAWMTDEPRPRVSSDETKRCMAGGSKSAFSVPLVRMGAKP